MKIVSPSFEILYCPEDALARIEKIARTCYKSEDKITPDSAEAFVRGIIMRGHEAMLEHVSVTARIICNRAIANELVRHRLASYAQESTRFVNYSKGKFGRELTFIVPPEMEGQYVVWYNLMGKIEQDYMTLIDTGISPQIARDILPLCLKTEVVITANLREWRHIFDLRCSKQAHPQIREIMLDGLRQLSERIPVVFEDLKEKYL
jgi:thymidylate synthase (FAD)